MNKYLVAIVAALLVITPLVIGDTLRLKDGTKLEGRVIPQGENYWIKLTDGATKTVSAGDVAEWIRGDSNAAGATGADAASRSPRPAANFSLARARANLADTPAAAVAIWKAFIDSSVGSPDLATAQQELDVWQKRVDEHAERVNGKWVGGDELKAMREKAGALFKEADRMMVDNQTLQAVAKLEEIVKIYPNHFPASFWLGFINLRAEKYDKAQANLENAIRIEPDSAEALSNLAIVLSFRKQYEKSVLTALKATTIKDSPETVLNLVNAISYAPEELRKNDVKLRPALEASTLLSSKYRITRPGKWIYVGLTPTAPKAPPYVDKDGKHWIAMGNGTGFILSSDGLILTNKHVAEEGDMLLVRLADGTQKQAERVVIDDEQDLALIRIKSDKPLPFLQLSAKDEPGPGAECTALGFPLGNIMRLTLQVTPGSVSSVIDADTANVVVTCKVNPGNSGGPLVDKFGNVVGIVTQKTLSNTSVESYGKAISAGRIRDFLKKQAAKSKATLNNGEDGTASLNTEAIYKKVSPAAVCIIIMKNGAAANAPKP